MSQDAPPAARPAWSITARLTVLYSISAFGILAIGAAFLYWELKSEMAAEDQQLLADKIRILRLILKEHPNEPGAFEEELKIEGAARQFNKYYARILGEKGQTVLETVGMGGFLNASAFPKPIDETHEPVEGMEWHSADSRSFYLMSAQGVAGGRGEERRVFQVALDVTHEDALLADYRHKLVLMLVAGLVISTIAGALVTRHGLRPVGEIAHAAQRVTASKLNERISPAGWPKELATLATEFDAMLHRLDESFTKLSQFSADLAHELRTPINNLVGEAEVALSKARTPEEYRQVIESSLEEYARLSRMIDSLLFLARAESAERRVQKVKLDARKEMEAVRDFHEAVAAEKGVAVTCEGEAVCWADSMLLRRALSNLLSNALKFTPRGGKVTAAVRLGDDQSVLVTVTDTGSGIAPDELPKIFDRFYKGRSSRGSGLGLTIARNLVAAHGGAIRAESLPGQGTTVTFTLPVDPT